MIRFLPVIAIFFLPHSSSGQALATEAIAEFIRSGGVWKAESNIKLLGLVSTPAAADWDASFTMESINLLENTAKASRRKCEFDQMREVLFVRQADDLTLATSHLAQILLRFARPLAHLRDYFDSTF